MKAFIVDRYGRKGGGRLGDIPEPELRDDDVLVRVHAAGVNPLDFKIRSGGSECRFAGRPESKTLGKLRRLVAQDQFFRKILSIALPRASSSISLSR